MISESGVGHRLGSVCVRVGVSLPLFNILLPLGNVVGWNIFSSSPFSYAGLWTHAARRDLQLSRSMGLPPTALM